MTATGRRAAGLAPNAALAALVLACAAWLAPSLWGFERYVITGGSMSGTFEKGSIALERERPVEDLRVGDVITYLPPASSGVHTLVTHRIVERTPGPAGSVMLRTQGDANPDPDPWTFSLAQETQPVVELTVPYAGHALIALADPRTRLFVIGLPATLVALAALRDLLRALRRPAMPAPAVT